MVKKTKLKTSRFERTLSLAKLGLNAGAKAAGYALGKVASSDASGARWQEFLKGQADVITNELQKLKGSVMKAGQMLSMVGEHFLPPEVNQILSKLRADSEPVEWEVMEKVVKRNLDAEALAKLDVDPNPYAAASIGQVHRARVKDSGEELCLKIQYPGIAKAMDSDISTLKSLLTLSRLLPRNIDFEPVFSEVRYMLRKELDYHKEREATLEYASLLGDDDRYRIPKVYPEFSGKRVLATQFMEGDTLNREYCQSLTQAERNHLGTAVLELFFKEFFVWGLIQTDPHFGNYRITRSKNNGLPQLILLDFGAVRRFSKEFLGNYRNFLAGALYGDKERFLAAAIALGMLSPEEREKAIEAFYGMCRLILEPYILRGEPGCNEQYMAADGAYNWGESDLASRVTKRAMEVFYVFKLRAPNREIIFFDRKVSGVFMTLNTIGPIFRARAMIDPFLSE